MDVASDLKAGPTTKQTVSISTTAPAAVTATNTNTDDDGAGATSSGAHVGLTPGSIGGSRRQMLGHCTCNSYSKRAHPLSHQGLLQQRGSVLGIQSKSHSEFLWRLSSRGKGRMARWGCSNQHFCWERCRSCCAASDIAHPTGCCYCRVYRSHRDKFYLDDRSHHKGGNGCTTTSTTTYLLLPCLKTRCLIWGIQTINKRRWLGTFYCIQKYWRLGQRYY